MFAVSVDLTSRFTVSILIFSLTTLSWTHSPFPLAVVINCMISAALPADTVEDNLQMWKGNRMTLLRYSLSYRKQINIYFLFHDSNRLPSFGLGV